MTSRQASKLLGKVYRGYVLKHLIQDGWRLMRRRVRRMQFDKRHMLHRVGLTPYSPGRAVAGAMGWLVAGGALGALVGLVLAPKAGSKLRQQVKERAYDWFARPEERLQASPPAQA